MDDPVILTTSNMVMDRTSVGTRSRYKRFKIDRMLLDNPHPKDPFTQKDLTPDTIKPYTELKQKIEEYKRAKLAGAKSSVLPAGSAPTKPGVEEEKKPEEKKSSS